jgi:hypothetical protein
VYSTLAGDGSTNPITITHNLGTKDVVVVIREVSTGDLVDAAAVATTTNAISVTWAVIPTTNQYEVTVISGGGASGPTGATGATGPQMTVALSASANSVTGTSSVSLALFGGSNISLATATGAGSLSVTFNASSNAINNVSSLNGSSGALSVSAGAGIGIGQANSTITISASVQAEGTQTISGGGTSISGTGISLNLVGGSNISLASASAAGALTLTFNASSNATNNVSSLNGSSGAMSVSAGANIGIGNANSTITISASNQTSSLSYVSALNGSSGGLSLIAGAGIGLSSNASTMTISTTTPTLKMVQGAELQAVAAILIASVTTTGSTAAVQPFNSSLFLSRIVVPIQMNLTEVDLAIGLAFPATNQGAGSVSQSLVVYSFGNSTSLASVLSASLSNTWTTGTATVAAQSYTQSQGGWAGSNIKPMTFAASNLPAGDYVIGNLIAFAGLSTSWTVTLFGANANISSSASLSAITNVTSASLGALSSGNASGVWAFSGTTLATVLSNAGLSTFRYVSQSAATSTNFNSTTQATASSLSGSQGAHFSTAPTLVTVVSASSLTNVFAFPTTGSINAVTNVGQASNTTNMTFASATIPAFGFIGTQVGSTTTAQPFGFIAGVMSTGAVPTSIALTTTALTVSGSTALIQPWFALIGS